MAAEFLILVICLTRIPEIQTQLKVTKQESILTKPNKSGKEVVRDVSIDESAYSEFIPDLENTYFKEVFDVLSSKYKLGRVRILLKEPRSTLSWHRDPEPRLHIPIITNPGCLMVIDNVVKHMPADDQFGLQTILSITMHLTEVKKIEFILLLVY